MIIKKGDNEEVRWKQDILERMVWCGVVHLLGEKITIHEQEE